MHSTALASQAPPSLVCSLLLLFYLETEAVLDRVGKGCEGLCHDLNPHSHCVPMYLAPSRRCSLSPTRAQSFLCSHCLPFLLSPSHSPNPSTAARRLLKTQIRLCHLFKGLLCPMQHSECCVPQDPQEMGSRTPHTNILGAQIHSSKKKCSICI